MQIKAFIGIIWIVVCLLSSSSLIAQPDGKVIEFHGKVSCDGRGISGVAVTNGVSITQTNEKGEFKLLSNTSVEFVYITLPSGYTIPVKNNSPCFFHRITDRIRSRQRLDFILEKSPVDDNKHVVIVCADPQVAFDDELPLLKNEIDDMQALIADNYPKTPVFGMICGDIIAEIKNEPKFFTAVKQLFADSGIPFFYAAGNHDMDVTGRSNYHSKKTFEENFGPAYYSFNRGKVHYVVLDDVFFTGRGYSSIGYLDEIQLSWLEQDLLLVPKSSTVVVALHIPTYSREARKGEFAKEEINKVLQNRRVLYKMLEPYNAHILSGHEHYNENYILGNRLFEHVHAALCGIFWQAPYSSDGAPLGYGVYEFDGTDVKWYYKVAGKDKGAQFNAYAAGADKHKPDAIIANVWNYDPEWKIFWYEDDVKMGEMKQYTGWDPAIVDYVEKNRNKFRYKYVGAGPTEHLFYAEPVNKNAKIRIEVVDRFNNVYTSESLNFNSFFSL